MKRWFCVLLAAPALWAEPVVADLGWLAGHWRAERGGAVIEEVWTAPEQGNMTGMFRMLQEGRVVFFELFSAEDSIGGAVVYLRHFRAGLLALEDREKPMRWAVEEVSAGLLVLRRFDDRLAPAKLTYRLEGDELVATLERPQGGEEAVSEYRYRRAGKP
ncbi:MAG: hypothetical protein IPM24_25955 [Bryobacterales bacterium]|nr:hypothetical protein [Bryobacterales bacterium]